MGCCGGADSPRCSVVRSIFAEESFTVGVTDCVSYMTSVGLVGETMMREGEVGATGKTGEHDETGDRAESTETVVTVEFDLSTLRWD